MMQTRTECLTTESRDRNKNRVTGLPFYLLTSIRRGSVFNQIPHTGQVASQHLVHNPQPVGVRCRQSVLALLEQLAERINEVPERLDPLLHVLQQLRLPVRLRFEPRLELLAFLLRDEKAPPLCHEALQELAVWTE